MVVLSRETSLAFRSGFYVYFSSTEFSQFIVIIILRLLIEKKNILNKAACSIAFKKFSDHVNSLKQTMIF